MNALRLAAREQYQRYRREEHNRRIAVFRQASLDQPRSKSIAPENPSSLGELGEREKRFLDRLSRKYEKNEAAGRVRSYAIASVVLLAIFALSSWVPWWGVALAVVEAVGLALFHQYKRFAAFKSRVLRKLWRDLAKASN